MVVKARAVALALVPFSLVSAFVVFPATTNVVSRGSSASPRALSATTARMAADVGRKRVLVIGGTRFSGLYLTKELHSRGHEVCLLFVVCCVVSVVY